MCVGTVDKIKRQSIDSGILKREDTSIDNMRRGPVVSNVFSITSSYLLMKSVTRFLNKRLPKNNKYPWWWKEVTTIEETETNASSCLQESVTVSDFVSISSSFVNKDIENIITPRITNVEDNVFPLNSTRSQHIILMFETWNKWIDDEISTFLLYFVILFCLLYLPLHDLYEGKEMKRRRGRKDLYSKNGRNVLQISSGLNDDLVDSKSQNSSISNEVENIDSHVAKNIINGAILESENKLDTIEEEMEYKELADSQQDKDGVTKIKNLSNHTATSSFVSTPELSHLLKHDQTSINSSYKSDQFYQTSQASTVSSASSFIQFSPSKSSHLDAQVNTRNAYSQPFRFK